MVLGEVNYAVGAQVGKGHEANFCGEGEEEGVLVYGGAREGLVDA